MTNPTTTTSSVAGCSIEKPSVDKREYKHMRLLGSSSDDSSSLQVLLISDPDTDKASASMDIGIGQFCDGDFCGIAHFLEHMLFIGTEKYPDENAYDSYLNSHGGSSNAFTDLEHTCYYFDVQAESLEGALDRFAQCFLGPLFSKSALEREVQAVDSEHAKNLMQDMWRFYQLSKSKLVSNGHPFGSFGSGNAESLPTVVASKDDTGENETHIREQLVDFFHKYYRKSLGLYKLVVLGKESLDDLEAMVSKYFVELVDLFQADSHEDTLSKDLYPAPDVWNVPQRLHIVPVSQVHGLELQFPMREIKSLYRSKPTRYLSHLLGHEGRGSLLSLLKAKQYATDLYADDSSKSCASFSIFTIKMELTDHGLEHVDEIVSMVFAYRNLLVSKGPQEWIHNEAQTVSDMQFRFLSQRNPMDYTCSLAGFLQQYPPELCLSGAYKTFDWDADLVAECLESITPQNLLLMVSSPTFEGQTKETEPWYGTKYSTIEPEPNLWRAWETVDHSEYPELSLPFVNDMIPTDFEILHPSSSSSEDDFPKDRPQCIHQDGNVRLWYKPDNVFDMPKVNLMYRFSSGQGIFSPHASVAAQVLTELVTEQCNEFSYEATMAGLYCQVSPSSSGLDLQVSGYNHKAHVLVEKLLTTTMDLVTSKVDTNDLEELFERVTFKIEQAFQSFLVGQPYQHCIYGGDLVLEQKTPIEDKMNVLKSITLEEVLIFAKDFFKYCSLEGLVHGNVSAQHAYDITHTVWGKTHPTNKTASTVTRAPLEKRVVELGQESPSFLYRFPEFNEGNTNSCVQVLLQLGALDLETNSTLALFAQLIREPSFNQLRTEEQLGYIVHTSVKTSGDHVKGLLLLIQSDAFVPSHVEERIEVFLANFRQTLVEMSETDFQTFVDTVVASFLEKNKNLGEESSRYWHVILNQTYDFSRYQKIADCVKTHTKGQILRFYDRYIGPKAPCRRKLCVHVVAKQHEESSSSPSTSSSSVIEDPLEFRRSMPLFSMPPKVDVEVVDLGIESKPNP